MKIFIESVNVELEKSGSCNRILNVSPGSIAGTSFNNGKTDISVTKPLAQEIIVHLENQEDLFRSMRRFFGRYWSVIIKILEKRDDTLMSTN